MYLCKPTAKWHIITIRKAIKLRFIKSDATLWMHAIKHPLPDNRGMGNQVTGDGTEVEAKWN